MDQPIRFGILGCARIARRGVIAGIRAAAGAQLVAIASRRGEVASAWASEFGIPRSYGSYEALLADPAVDAIYNPLPNELHLPWTLHAAEAGKHVLCEKPLGLDYAEAGTMAEACRRHAVMLMEAFMWRHHPRTAKALELLHAGRLGDLRLIKMEFSFEIDRADWRLDPARGGGALFDIGCYGVNAARLFAADEPIEIVARGHKFATGVDMTAAIMLRFAGDVMAVVDASFETPYRNRLELIGTRATLDFPDAALPAPQTTLAIKDPSGTEVLNFPRADQYALEIEAFCQGIRSGSLPYPAENGLANMKVLTEARRQLLAT